ncbi:MAG: hypothetical protein DDT41_00840 [candidate division WS2 bacterium]|nr:hypothetical protein [Candidatus Psychracetigena formicireducens]
MPYCSVCGDEISSDLRFCSKCESKVGIGPQVLVGEKRFKRAPIKGILVGVIILLITTVGVYLFLTRNQAPVIVSLEAPSVVAINEKVSLTSSATDEDGDNLTYTWEAEAGTILGEGAYVNYTAPDTPGSYTLTLSVSDGRGGRAKQSINIKVLLLWQKTYGGKGGDSASSIQQTTDGGYIVAGTTDSFGAGSSDIYLLKLDPQGKVIWEKTYGGKGGDSASSIQQTTDGGYIVAGYTSPLRSGGDIYILKLDSQGGVIWEKTYGGEGGGVVHSIQQTLDGGYIVAGETLSFRTRVNIYLLKLDSQGGVIWEKTYGGEGDDRAYSIQQTSDGGYIVAGYTWPLGGGIRTDIYLLKLDSQGKVIWEKTYGGKYDDVAHSIQQTQDGGYIVAGYTSPLGSGGDIYLLKLDSQGKVIWEKTYGGEADEWAYSIQQTLDGGYIVAGFKFIYFGVSKKDVYLLKLDSQGKVIWEKTYGGKYDDVAYSIRQTLDGGYIVAGYTDSFGVGGYDVYLLKLDSQGKTGPYPPNR